MYRSSPGGMGRSADSWSFESRSTLGRTRTRHVPSSNGPCNERSSISHLRTLADHALTRTCAAIRMLRNAAYNILSLLVPEARLELAHPCRQQILSLSCLPIPPLRPGPDSIRKLSPNFVARAPRSCEAQCRGSGPHLLAQLRGPKERLRAGEGVVDTGAFALSKRLAGVRPAPTATLGARSDRLASAAGNW